MFPIENSSLYQEWLAERAEVDKLKWVMSEAVGHDVGWDHAYWTWVMTRRSAWRAGFRASGLKFQAPS
jgi:hypothetical protein